MVLFLLLILNFSARCADLTVEQKEKVRLAIQMYNFSFLKKGELPLSCPTTVKEINKLLLHFHPDKTQQHGVFFISRFTEATRILNEYKVMLESSQAASGFDLQEHYKRQWSVFQKSQTDKFKIIMLISGYEQFTNIIKNPKKMEELEALFKIYYRDWEEPGQWELFLDYVAQWQRGYFKP